MRTFSGFSLLELVVTIAIAAILAAIAIPRFTDAEAKATWFHEQALAAVRYAQRQAVAQRRCVFVTATTSQISLFYGTNACALSATPVVSLSTGNAYVLDAPSGVVIGPTSFGFNGLGQPQPVTGATLVIGAKTITVTAETGYVQ